MKIALSILWGTLLLLINGVLLWAYVPAAPIGQILGLLGLNIALFAVGCPRGLP